MQSLDTATENLALHRFLETLLETAHQRIGIPGLAVAVRHNRHTTAVAVGLRAAHNRELLAPSAGFQIGCIVKLLTATAVAQLVTEGAVEVEAPIAHYLPELGRPGAGGQIQVKHLLSHTSGYAGAGINAGAEYGDPRLSGEAAWKRFIGFFHCTPQLFHPGGVFSYENTEYVILGQLVARLSGRDVEDYYCERILRPLAIFPDSLIEDAQDVAAAGHQYCPSARQWKVVDPAHHNTFWRASVSGWSLNVTDLCQLGHNLLGGSGASDGRSLSEFLVHPVVVLPPLFPSEPEIELLPQSFGLGAAWFRGGILGHNGAARGQVCGLRVDPSRNTTIALALSAYQPLIRDQLLEQVMEFLRGAATPKVDRECVPIEPHELAGRYTGAEDACVNVRWTSGQLIAEITAFRNTPPTTVRFDVDENGQLRRNKRSPLGLLRFFRRTPSGAIALMLGLTTYRKELFETRLSLRP